ncbi:MAG: hypothetical protein ACR2JI_13265 [Mycobacterium sp.]
MYRLRAAIGGAALLVALSGAGPAHADPSGPADPGIPAPADPAAAAIDPPVDALIPPGPGSGNPVSDACKQFTAALNVAATNYEDFAYASAGNGNVVNYQDPVVDRANQVGRVGLRVAAGAVMDASRTPGLPPEVADPMQSWSMHATKLMIIMGLRGGGDSLNSAATDLNTDANNVQTACAVAMSRG